MTSAGQQFRQWQSHARASEYGIAGVRLPPALGWASNAVGFAIAEHTPASSSPASHCGSPHLRDRRRRLHDGGHRQRGRFRGHAELHKLTVLCDDNDQH